MKFIHITGEKVSRGLIWEQTGKSGKRAFVPTYLAALIDENRPQLDYKFEILRDSSDVVFRGISERYQTLGECPPHQEGNPYQAYIDDSKIGNCLRVYQKGSSDRHHLIGIGDTQRSNILFHHGPACSYGCFVIAGGKRGWDRFFDRVRRILDPDEELTVFVDSRPEEHHTKYAIL